MLDPHPLEVRRHAPAEGALLLAEAAPRLAGVVAVGTLPAVLGLERRAELLRAAVQRREAPRAAELVVVAREALPVVVAVGLARALGRVDGVAVRAAEAPGAVRREVELGLARRDPLGDRAADPAGAAEAVQGEPAGAEEAAHARQRAEQRVAVRRHRVGVRDELYDACVGEEREAAHGARHQDGEALLVLDHGPGPRATTARPAPARRRVGLVAAEEDAARLALAVDEVVGVAEARHVARARAPGRRGARCAGGRRASRG